MTTVVCDVTEGANAVSSVLLGFTETLFHTAVAVSIIVPGITGTMVSTGNATSYVDATKGYEVTSTGNATSFAPSQLVLVETVRETADAKSFTGPALTENALSNGAATSSVVLSRDTTVLSAGNGTSPVTGAAQATLTVTERADAQSLVTDVNTIDVVSTGNATSFATTGLVRSSTVSSTGAGSSFVTGLRAIVDSVESHANAISLASSTASLNWTVTEQGVATSFVVLPLSLDAWIMNTETTAMSRYTGVPVGSVAMIGGLTLGAGDDGLFLMAGATDGGAQIRSSVLTGRLELGSPALKSLGDITLDYVSSGAISVRVLAYSGKGTEDFTYSLPARIAAAPRAGRVSPGKGLRSRFYQFEFKSKDGASFSVDSVLAQVAVTTRRV